MKGRRRHEKEMVEQVRSSRRTSQELQKRKNEEWRRRKGRR